MKIFKQMSEVMKDIGTVSKDQKNQAQGFKFRGIDQFVNALYPALTKHGVFMAPRATSFTQDLKDVVRSSGKSGIDKHVSIMMEYDFYAEDGSKVTIGPIPAEGVDSGDKATNKALSAALKYALIQTFSIPTEDMAEADLHTIELGKPYTAASYSGNPTVTTAKAPSTPTAKTDPVALAQAAAAPATTDELARDEKPTTVAPLTKSSFRKPGKAAQAAAAPTVAPTEGGWDA